MPISVHETKGKIYRAVVEGKIKRGMSYRDIGKVIGVPHPQQIKHHLDGLVKMGTIHYINGDYDFKYENSYL